MITVVFCNVGVVLPAQPSTADMFTKRETERDRERQKRREGERQKRREMEREG